MFASVEAIENSAEVTNDWLKELSSDLGWQDLDAALKSLCAVLHGLRDQLPPEVSTGLAAQLPLYIRALFYENWAPGQTSRKIHDVDEFIECVQAELQDETLREQAPYIVLASLGLLNRRLNPAAAEVFRQSFPEELDVLWPAYMDDQPEPALAQPEPADSK